MTRLYNRDYLICVWRDLETRQRFVIGKLSRNGMYEFEYDGEGVADAKKHGFELLISFPDVKKTYTNESMFAVFKSRLPDKKRKNIDEILEKYNLAEYDDFELLKKTEGKLPIDTIEFIEPVFLESVTDKGITISFFVAGTRYHDFCEGDPKEGCNIELDIQVNDKLLLVPEPENEFDTNAVMIRSKDNKYKIGYVPSFYAKAVSNAIRECYYTECIVKSIEKINCQECLKVNLEIKKVNNHINKSSS
jgi:HipA-like protein